MTNYSKRFLTVGSLLRPKELLDYKSQIEQREDITYPFYEDVDGYKETEKESIEDVVSKQINHGLTVVTDGEHGRSLWHLDFAWGFDGIDRFIADQGYIFADGYPDKTEDTFETRKDIGLSISGKLSGKNHHFINLWKDIRSNTPENIDVKQTIPAPSQIYFDLLSHDAIEKSDVYESDAEFKKDLVNTYKAFLDDYKTAGGKIIQLDDCVWARFDTPEEVFGLPTNSPAKDDFEALAQSIIDLNNQVADYAHELGLKVWGHNCRGNYASRAAMTGTYQSIADFFLRQLRYDRFFLEWDDERAGSIEALKAFGDRPEVEVVLGALSSKKADLDDEERAIKLLDEASQYINKDNLYLSHQCGFASCDCGNVLSEDQQWNKIDHGHQIALKYFGE